MVCTKLKTLSCGQNPFESSHCYLLNFNHPAIGYRGVNYPKDVWTYFFWHVVAVSLWYKNWNACPNINKQSSLRPVGWKVGQAVIKRQMLFVFVMLV